MNIPEDAVQAASRAWHEHLHPGRDYDPKLDRAALMVHALAAAAPFIAAQALRDAARNITSGDWATYGGFGPGIRWSAEDIRQHADELDPQ